MKESFPALYVARKARGYFGGKLIYNTFFLQTLLPQENQESLQSLIFLLERELKQQESEIMNMFYYVIKKRYSQLVEYQKKVNEEMEKAHKGKK